MKKVTALAVLVAFLGETGLAIYMFGFKNVLIWTLLSIGTLLCGYAAHSAIYLIKNDALQRLIDGFTLAAIPAVTGLTTVGLVLKKEGFVFSLCLIQGFVFILVCLARMVSLPDKE